MHDHHDESLLRVYKCVMPSSSEGCHVSAARSSKRKEEQEQGSRSKVDKLACMQRQTTPIDAIRDAHPPSPSITLLHFDFSPYDVLPIGVVN
eukprot:scaffold2102_cov145-Skeletonema_menzelii.AAC.12